MSRLVAYMGSDPERLKVALQEHREQLLVQGKEGEDSLASFGIGFYQGGEVLLQRRPRVAARTIDLFEAVKDLRTDAFLAQVRSVAHSKTAKDENTPPFRFRSWLMVERGVPPLEGLRERALQLIPDFLRRNLRGQTDTELLFHLYLAALHEGGRLVEDANLPPEGVLQALTRALGQLDGLLKEAGPAEGFRQVAATNGRCLVVLRRGPEPIWLRRMDTMTNGGRSQEHFRGYLFLCGGPAPGGDGKGYEEVPAEHAALIGRDLNVRLVPLSA